MIPVLAGRGLVAGVLLCGSLLLSGCAGLAPAPAAAYVPRAALEAFSVEGRFSLRSDDSNYSGRLSWRHSGVSNELLLSSPFGQGMAEIATSADGARLATNDGKVYEAEDAETLTRQVLGYVLPLAQLTDWVQGRGAGIEPDPYGRPLRLRHEDWRIEYGYDSDDPRALPSRIFASRAAGFELRLRIDAWNDIVPKESKP